jgi:hypothetical protein
VVDRCAQLSKTQQTTELYRGCIRLFYDLFRAGIPLLSIQITAGTKSRMEKGYGYVSKLKLAALLQ